MTIGSGSFLPSMVGLDARQAEFQIHLEFEMTSRHSSNRTEKYFLSRETHFCTWYLAFASTPCILCTSKPCLVEGVELPGGHHHLEERHPDAQIDATKSLSTSAACIKPPERSPASRGGAELLGFNSFGRARRSPGELSIWELLSCAGCSSLLETCQPPDPAESLHTTYRCAFNFRTVGTSNSN
jgi:hypothetical protein